ncbi:hypothetical protein NDU88_008058 [Pleurodeles waltl]|uniref:Uncharacterized protein n=1 Tax=Pleurodeles waltl TaxID=8319 RepID=A0AAV7PR11_PLEWA|nr:hypothetical protein NDU88_008058 [Pleurodeles waltl]
MGEGLRLLSNEASSGVTVRAACRSVRSPARPLLTSTQHDTGRLAEGGDVRPGGAHTVGGACHVGGDACSCGAHPVGDCMSCAASL